MTCNDPKPITEEEILELIRQNDGIKFEDVLLTLAQKRFDKLSRESFEFMEDNKGSHRQIIWGLAHKGKIIIGAGYDLHVLSTYLESRYDAGT